MAGPPSFCRPSKPDEPSQHLFIGNCGPKTGISREQIQEMLSPYDDSATVFIPSQDASHAYATLKSPEVASAARDMLNGRVCSAVSGRIPVIKFAQLRLDKPAAAQLPVATAAKDTGIPGLQLLLDFVSPEEEQQLLAHIDPAPWTSLAKRRVQHYGYTFEYSQRSINPNQGLGELPGFVQDVIQHIQALPGTPAINQLTVNEYTPGVGLSPHIDTHSAFTGAITSLSLAGPCVMELRRLRMQQQQQQQDQAQQLHQQQQQQGEQDQQQGEHAHQLQQLQQHEQQQEQQQVEGSYDRRLLFLPPRSLLIMGGEARYAWEHYIPHRRSDPVNGTVVPRALRRVSLTFRETRGHPCDCHYQEYCDSQKGGLPPTRLAQLQQQQQEEEGYREEGKGGGVFVTDTAICSQPCGNSSRCSSSSSLHNCAAPVEVQSSTSKHGGVGMAELPGIRHYTQPSSSTAAAAAAGGGDGGSSSTGVWQQQARGDSAQSFGPADANEIESESAAAEQMESVYVHQVYDAIAPHFSATRFAIWPKVRQFLEAIPSGGVVADVGCGNGKYFGVRMDLAVLGSDRSAGLATVAAARVRAGASHPRPPAPAADVLVADALHLPYRSSSCDAVLCIAVLHHISTITRRLQLLRELARVLKPGGRGIVTVWATEQEDPVKTIEKWALIKEGTGQQQEEEGEEVAEQEDEGEGRVSAGAQGAREGGRQVTAAAAGSAEGEEEARGAGEGALSGDIREDAGWCSSSSSSNGLASPGAGGGDAAAVGPDYLVPWHVPFHRAGTLVKQLTQQQQQGLPGAGKAAGESTEGAEVASGASAVAAAVTVAGTAGGGNAAGVSGAVAGGAPRVNAAKGAVVYQRYYHLFDEGELAGLVGQVAGVKLVDAFYDRSNWCVVFEKL